LADCPSCGRELQLTPEGNPFCPECRLSASQAQERRSRTFADYYHRFPATIILIAVNLLVFVAMLLGHVSATGPTIDQLIRWGGDSGDRVLLHNQWWRIVTAAFVHIGAAHLIMNMWALWVLGTLAEAVLGTYLYVGIYFVCAIAGSLASLYWNPGLAGAGASGAIMGILGAEVSVLKFARLPLPKEVLRSTLRSLVQGAVLTLVIGLLPRIDNAAHVGGLACGLFIGLLLSLTRRADYTRQRPLRQICLLAPFALMVPLALAVQKHGEPRVHLQEAEEELGASHYDQAEREARIALRHLPNQENVLAVLSAALYYQGNDAEAGKYLRQLLAHNPRSEFAVNTLALIELKNNDAIGARDLLINALAQQPRNAYGEFYLGTALQTLNADDQAIAHYRKALQIDPQMYEANMALAWVFEKQDRPQDAIALYQKATQIRPSEVEPLRGLARCYRAAGMTVQADQTLAEIQKRVQATGNR
jgi:membrane associated rhomboid family serine protease/Flp pilus assembly protein TadD